MVRQDIITAHRNNILRIKMKYTLFIIIGMLVSSITNAQQFMMSSVGILSGSSSNATSINFKSNATCIDVQSGIAVYKGTRSFGDFAVDCAITQQFNSLGIKLFPNPVRTSTKVKFINTPPLTETFSLSIWSTEGAMLFSKKETGYDIFQGVLIDLSNLASGSYVLKIESTKYMDAIKFIKAN
jgi:hypothetical protein